jgi:hypothetical protein
MFEGVFNSYVRTSQPLSFSSIPEPSAIAAIAAAGLLAVRRRRMV